MRVFTVVGPSQSGKSTLVTALAGLEGSRAQTMTLAGEVKVTKFDFMGDNWAAFEVPGGLDSAAYIGPLLAASDAAILCAPAELDAAVLNAPYLRKLEDSGVPTFAFINKIDTSTDRVADLVASLQSYSAHGIILRQVPMRADGEVVGAIDLISERAWKYQESQPSKLVELPEAMMAREQEARSDLLESLADFDDTLLEQIIEDQVPGSDSVYGVATRVLQHHDLIPALLGSAENGNGVFRLMKSLRHETPNVEAISERLGLSSGVKAAAAVGDTLPHIGKATLLRALAPISSGVQLGGDSIGGLTDIGSNTQFSGLEPGEIGLAIKSDHLVPGQFLTDVGTEDMPPWSKSNSPALKRLTHPVNERDEGKLSSALQRLAELDPGLTIAQDEATGLREVGLQGTQHLRSFTERLKNSFGIEVECSEVPTALRETIRRGIEKHHRHRKQSGGAGQFADVVMQIAPQPLGAGFTFTETVKGGAVPRNYIPAVEHGVKEALAEGPHGHPVVDIAVTLTDGKHHSVDSSDFAFRTAGKNGIRDALNELGTVLLQPIMNVHIHVPSIFAGGLVQTVTGLKGQVLRFEGHPTATGWDVFEALLPMASEEDLARALSSATRGTAWFESKLHQYEELRVAVGA